MTVPSDFVASYLLWKHFSSPLHWGQQKKGSSLKCVSAKQTETGWPRSQSCLLPRLPSPGHWRRGLAKRSHLVENNLAMQRRRLEAATPAGLSWPSADLAGVPLLQPRGHGLISTLQQWVKAAG